MWDSINPNKGEYDVRNLINMQFQQAQMLMDLQQQLLKVKQIEDSNIDSESQKLQNADSIDILQSQYPFRHHLGSVSEAQSQRPPKPLDQNKKQLQKDIALQIQEVIIGSATDSRKRKSIQKQVVQDLIQEKQEIKSFEKNLTLQNPLIESNIKINLQNQVFSKRSDNSVKSKLSHTCLSNISQQKASTLSLIQKIYQQMEKIDQHIESKEKVDLERYSKMERRMNRLFQKYSKIKEENLKIQIQAEQEVMNSQSICTSELRFNDTNENDEITEQINNEHSYQNSIKRSSKEEPRVKNSQSQLNKRYQKDISKQEKDIEKIDIAIAGAESTLYSQNFIQMELNNQFFNKKQNNQIEMVNSKHISKNSYQNGKKIEILEYSGQNSQIKTNQLQNKESGSMKEFQRQNKMNKRDLKSEYESTSSLQNEIEQSESLKSKTYAGISNCGSIIEDQLKINAASDNSIVNYIKANDFANQQLHQQTQSINQIHNSQILDQISTNQLYNQFQSNNYNIQSTHQNQLNERSIQISQNQLNQNYQIQKKELYQNCQNQNQYQNNNVELLLNQNEKKQNEMVNQLIQPLSSNQLELEHQVQQMNKSIEVLKNEHLSQMNQMKQFYAEQFSKIREEVKVASILNNPKSQQELPKISDTPVNIHNSKSQDNFMNLTNLTMSASDQHQNRKQEVFINPNLQVSHSIQQEDNIDQKIHFLEKQKNIEQKKSTVLDQDSKLIKKSQSELQNYDNEIEKQAQQKAQEAINKLMDQRKFTDTIEQLNQAVQQKEQLEQKLQRIKDKIQMAKNIKQKQGQQESQKQRISVQSHSKSRYDNCGESAEIKTSDIYLMVKQNELSDEQTQSIVSGSYRHQIQINPKTEKASFHHNSSQNLLINQSDNINQPINSCQATPPPIYNDLADQQSRFFLESSFVQNNQVTISEEEKKNDFKQELESQSFLKNNKIEKTSVFSGDFGLSINKEMQNSEQRHQNVSQSFEDIVNQQSAPHLVKQETRNSQLFQNNNQSIESSQMHQRSQDFNQLQQNSSKDIYNNNLNSLIKIDQQHSAYQQYLVANSSVLGSTLLNQNSEQQSNQNKNKQTNLNVQIQPFADPTFSINPSSNQNSQNQILSQSQSNLSFQRANNQQAIYTQKDNQDQNLNFFNQQRFSNNNLNLQQINQNLKAASLNDKFAKPFVPAKSKQNIVRNDVELSQQPVIQNKIKDSDNCDKILDIYLENTSVNQEQNGIAISNQIQYNKSNNENRRGIYQKIVDLQQQQNNNPYKHHIYLNGHQNTCVGTVTSSQQNIDQFAQANNGSFQSSQGNTLMNQDNAFTHSQQKENNPDSQFQNMHYQMNYNQNCNPLRKSPIRQAIGSGLAVNTNNSILLPISASVDYSLSQTNYGTISDHEYKQLNSLPKSISNSLHQQDRQEYMINKQQSFSYNQDQQINNNNSFNYPDTKTNYAYQIQDSQNQVSKHIKNLQQLGNSQLFKSPVPLPIVHNYSQQLHNNQFNQQIQQTNNTQSLYQPQNRIPNGSNNLQTQNSKGNQYFSNSQQQYLKNYEKEQKNYNNNEYKYGGILKNSNVIDANQHNMNRQSVQVYSNHGARISSQSNYQPKSDGNYQPNNQMNQIKSNQNDLRSGVFSFSHTQNAHEMKQNLIRSNQVKIENDNTPKQLKVQQLESENASYTLNSRTIEDDFTSSQRSTSKMTSEVMNSEFSLKY